MVFERADYTKTLDILDPKLVMANSGFKPIEQFKSQVFSFSKPKKKKKKRVPSVYVIRKLTLACME